MLKPFLTANWRYLAMMNFVIDPKIRAFFVPNGTEVDLALYGEQFAATPASKFIAEGSHVQVWRKIDDSVLVEAMTSGAR